MRRILRGSMYIYYSYCCHECSFICVAMAFARLPRAARPNHDNLIDRHVLFVDEVIDEAVDDTDSVDGEDVLENEEEIESDDDEEIEELQGPIDELVGRDGTV